MEKMPLVELAQYFATNTNHKVVASTINDMPKKAGDHYCPFCLGTEGRKLLLRNAGRPEGEKDMAEEFKRCGTCNTWFATDGDMWRAL
jgi:hypothetical protein